MNDQIANGTILKETTTRDKAISPEDRDILRQLALEMAELASLPIQKEKAALWTAHNDLQHTRPLVFCDPENGWNEIISEDDLQCKSELSREWEMYLRKEIYWGTKFNDDKVIDAIFYVPYAAIESDWGMHERRIVSEKTGGAYKWEAPLKDYKDLDKLHYPTITVDHIATNRIKGLAEEVFGDILEIKVKHKWWWSLGLTLTLVNIRGLEQIMYDMYDYPDELHKLMEILRDGHMAKLDFLQENGLLPDNTGNTYVGSGGFGYTKQLPQKNHNPEKVMTQDMWGFCESQETSVVSPEMFREFILPYQLPIAERFGLNCYGCCEPLDGRFDYIQDIHNLRRVSVSPWSNTELMAEKLSNQYIYSYKPNPAYLAVGNIDEGFIRKSLRELIRKTKNCCLEIIMKDNNTIGGNPYNVYKWIEIAKQETQNA